MAKTSIAITPSTTHQTPPIFPKDCAIPAPKGAVIVGINLSAPQVKIPKPKRATAKKTAKPTGRDALKPQRKRTAAKQQQPQVKLATTAIKRKTASKTKPTPPKIADAAIHLPDLSQSIRLNTAAASAIPLTQTPERLVETTLVSPPITPPIQIHAKAGFSTPPLPRPYADTAIPKNHRITRPHRGLIPAISQWIRSSKLLEKLGLVKRRRPLPISPSRVVPMNTQQPSQISREQLELTQMRAENRRLRSQIEALIALEEARKLREKI